MKMEVAINSWKFHKETWKFSGPWLLVQTLKKHKDKLVSQQGVQFRRNCSEWDNFDNFERMYNHVYEAMELNGVAAKLLA